MELQRRGLKAPSLKPLAYALSTVSRSLCARCRAGGVGGIAPTRSPHEWGRCARGLTGEPETGEPLYLGTVYGGSASGNAREPFYFSDNYVFGPKYHFSALLYWVGA